MPAITTPPRTGSLWQQRIQGMREFEVIRDGNVFGTSFPGSFLYTSEYDAARDHLAHLLEQYRDVAFSSAIPGRDVTNDAGTCFVQESRYPLSCSAVDIDRFRNEILSDLTLVRGIGPAVQSALWRKGYRTVPDLAGHPRFQTSAKEVLSCLSSGNSSEIMDLIGKRKSRSHKDILGTCGLHDPEDFVFFDIETLGLFSRPVILFGIASLDSGSLVISQYLLRDIDEEPSALLATTGHLSGHHPALVTFNGRSFDIPYLTDRLAYYGMGTPAVIPHYDMLHFSRRRWKGEIPSLRLTSLEKAILGINRPNDIPGAMVPEFYETYQRSGNCGPLIPILEHNRQDVVSLARLFFHLLGEYYDSL